MAYKDKKVAERYANDYIRDKYDRVNVTLPKGAKEKIQEVARANGESVNALIWRLLKAELDRIEKEDDDLQAAIADDSIDDFLHGN